MAFVGSAWAQLVEQAFGALAFAAQPLVLPVVAQFVVAWPGAQALAATAFVAMALAQAEALLASYFAAV